ncbi:MAG: lysozyme [Hyphomonadaceae bacterium]|nr:lysozyme [Hyphomonadaceae bacterium]
MAYTISSAGLTLLRKLEGFRAKPAPTGEGAWVVGYSHRRTGAPGTSVTQAEARALLAGDLAPFEAMVNKLVSRPIGQAQFDALVSFAFSIGVEAFAQSNVLKLLNDGEVDAAAAAMESWRSARVDGALTVVQALARRRAAERAHFLKDVPIEAAPSALLRAVPDQAPPADARPRRAIGIRLTEILRSEPATAALLQAPPATTRHGDGDDDGDEITTAHAKPVARREFEAAAAGAPKKRFPWLKRSNDEQLGAGGLLVLGLALTGMGAAIVVGGEGGVVDFVGGAALIAPGVIAGLVAAQELRRNSFG